MEIIERYQFVANELIHAHPPRLKHPWKQLIYELACPAGSVHTGMINYSRWRAASLPSSTSHRRLTLVQKNGSFKYPKSNVGVCEWHVNFADPDLFFGYGSGLFAQDEIQTAEHPALGSVREAVLACGSNPRTIENNVPTPVIISGVERRCCVNTKAGPSKGHPFGLYGKNFAAADENTVRSAVQIIHPPTITNLIAMAAPAYGRGRYTAQEIIYIAQTAVTAFSAARHESTGATRVVVHTGFWGCGAFGGNRTLMALLQLLAAEWVGIDQMVFYTFGPENAAILRSAATIHENLRVLSGMESALQYIVDLGLRWGETDGN